MQKTIDGVRLGYDVAGDGPALVLLHGFPLDRTIWDAQRAALASSCRVIRLDFRGSGESACGEGPALMETLAGDVFGLLDALDVDRAILAGHSMGGYVALAFFRMYAERVAGLALVASHVAADSAERRAGRDALSAALETRGSAALEAAIGTLLPALLGPRAAADPQLVARIRAIMARQSPAGAAAQVVGMKQRVGSEDLLEDIAVPAAILIGDCDPLIEVETARTTAAAIAGCTLERIAGAGHLPMLEDPQATTLALERFVARCATAV